MDKKSERLRARRESCIRFREPAIIKGAQIVGDLAAAVAGFLAVLNGLPYLLTGTIGPLMAVVVGSTLVVGGLLGTFAVVRGLWWLERVALLIVGLGWVMILPAAATFQATGRGGVGWLVVALICTALADIFKRYQKIAWAYLDPAK